MVIRRDKIDLDYWLNTLRYVILSPAGHLELPTVSWYYDVRTHTQGTGDLRFYEGKLFR